MVYCFSHLLIDNDFDMNIQKKSGTVYRNIRVNNNNYDTNKRKVKEFGWDISKAVIFQLGIHILWSSVLHHLEGFWYFTSVNDGNLAAETSPLIRHIDHMIEPTRN